MCRPQASPGRCGSEATTQGRAGWVGWGESRQPRLPRLTSHPQGGVSNLPGGCLSRHASLLILGAEVGVGRSSSHTGQAQLSKLQAGLADGHCHCRASHWIWPMRGHPSTSPREGLDHHPPACEAQCSFQVSVPTEESAQLGMKRKQARPELHRKESPRAGAGPGAKAGLTPPVFHTAVREGILL